MRLGKFNHLPGIVNIRQFFEENGTAYFVMDLEEGRDLSIYLKEQGGRIGWQEACDILIPVMKSLEYVHAEGIIHRDISPDNIFVRNDMIIKLLDFGAARSSLGNKSRSVDAIVKQGFSPREQYSRRGKQGAFTDVYSLAATFYYAVSGVVPPDSIERSTTDDPDDPDPLIPLHKLAGDVPAELEEAILKGMSLKPEKRFQSMKEFRQAIVKAVHREEERQKKERLEREHQEKERQEKERLERECQEKERLEKERLEQERLERERKRKERQEKARLEKECLERERLEKERLEKERLKQERLKKEQSKKERAGQKHSYTEEEYAGKVARPNYRTMLLAVGFAAVVCCIFFFVFNNKSDTAHQKTEDTRLQAEGGTAVESDAEPSAGDQMAKSDDLIAPAEDEVKGYAQAILDLSFKGRESSIPTDTDKVGTYLNISGTDVDGIADMSGSLLDFLFAACIRSPEEDAGLGYT